MAELPTQKDLEKLYHEKGRDSLACYVWHISLCSLTLLSELNLLEIWRHRVIQHIYATCRVPIFIIQLSAIENFGQDVADSFADDVDQASYSADSMYPLESSEKVINLTVALALLVDAVTKENTLAVIRHTNNLLADDKGLIESAMQTFNYISNSNLKSLAISPQKYCKALEVQWRNFLRMLNDLGLNFLANDLDDLWNGRPLGAHAKNYLKDFSDAELNDPVALRRLILEGEDAESIHAVRAL